MTALISLVVISGALFFFNIIYEQYMQNRQESLVYPKKSIMIPEGYTVAQIDKLMAGEGIIGKPGDILGIKPEILADDYPFLKGKKSMEGFLFPDTYEFFEKSSPETVVRKMLDNFKNKAWNKLEPLGGDTAYQRLILASIVEREVRDMKDDRAIVAGLLLKRMKIGMPLQTDVTICYVKDPLGCDGGVTKEDLLINSPYNTYLNRGLPPTPIDNPGLSAIEAAVNPKSSDYLFYISRKDTGETIFSKTIDEHNANVVKYLR
jgi:UPF0755 protein